MSKNPIFLAYDFFKGCENFKNELDKAKKINLNEKKEILALQIALGTWLSKFIPNPIKVITPNIDELADGTLKDDSLNKYQNDKYTDELINGAYHILQKYNFRFDSTRDMKIIFDEKYVATIPKEKLHQFNLVQEFINSAEMVYKELTTSDTFKIFEDIKENGDKFNEHSDNFQNVRIDFLADPESYLGKVINDFEINKKANEGLYKTPSKETTMSHTTSSFQTHSTNPSPECKVSNSGGKINFTIMIPIIVCSIPLSGGGSASLCSIM